MSHLNIYPKPKTIYPNCNSSTSNATFVWKMPCSDKYEKQLLCHGYTRENYPKYIINPVINLFADYYNPESFTLEDIKNANNLQLFVSPIFTFNSFLFYFEIHPNGSNRHNKGNVILYLCLAMIPKHVRQITVEFTLSLQETGTHCTRTCPFNRKKYYNAWSRGTLSLDQIQNLDELTFTVNIRRMYIATTDLDINTIEHPESTLFTIPVATTYKWSITDRLTVNQIQTAKELEHFISPIVSFGPFKWYFLAIPKHYQTKKPWIGFNIWYLPPNIFQCLCKIDIMFNELNILKTTYKIFDNECVGTAIYGEMEHFEELEHYSFVVDVSIIDILYEDNENGDDYMDVLEMKQQENTFTPVAMDKLPIFEYEWSINNKQQLTEIKNASNVFAFMSPIFEVFSLKWYISYCPNGSRISRKGTVNIFLNLVSFPSSSLRVPIKFEMQWVESGKTSIQYRTLSMHHSSIGDIIWPLTTDDLENLNTFTIKIKIWIGDIIEEQTSIRNKYIVIGSNMDVVKPRNIIIASQTFKWSIPSDVISRMKLTLQTNPYHKSLQFEMYAMKWHMMMYANGSSTETVNNMVLAICLDELPSITSIVSVRYTISVKETNTRYIGEARFTKNQMDSSWESERISTDTFKNLDELTIRLDMELIDVYDNNYRITNKFLPKGYYDILKHEKNGNVEMMKLEMDELEFIMDNMRTLNNYSNINENLIECDKDSQDDAEMNELKKWFVNELKMPEYYEQFVNAGISDLGMMCLLNKNDLIQIGVYNIVDISKLLIEISILNLCA